MERRERGKWKGKREGSRIKRNMEAEVRERVDLQREREESWRERKRTGRERTREM